MNHQSSFSASSSSSKRKRHVRVIMYNGWLRTQIYPFLWMVTVADYLKMKYGEDVEIVGNTVPAQSNKIEKYINHLANDMVGKERLPNEDTYFIGKVMFQEDTHTHTHPLPYLSSSLLTTRPNHNNTQHTGQSIGCQIIMRYLARLPPDTKVGGFLAVGCWLTLDYKTRRRRSRAIDELIEENWSTFQGWMDYSSIDFPVSNGCTHAQRERITHTDTHAMLIIILHLPHFDRS